MIALKPPSVPSMGNLVWGVLFSVLVRDEAWQMMCLCRQRGHFECPICARGRKQMRYMDAACRA